MSVCDVWIGQDAAIIATDTIGIGRPSGIAWPFSKVMALPHLGTVFAFRGERMSFQILLMEIISGNRLLGCFDDVADAMPAMIERVREVATPLEKPPGVDMTLQVVAVGWSDRSGAMAGAHSIFRLGEDAFHQGPEEFGGLFVPLGDDELSKTAAMPAQPDFDIERDIHELMARQVAQGRAENPETGFGGNLIIAFVSRHEITFRDLGPIAE